MSGSIRILTHCYLLWYVAKKKESIFPEYQEPVIE